MEKILYDNDWTTLTHFFPMGWEMKAKELGAMGRIRKVKSPSDLLKLLLMHLSANFSLMETVVRADFSGFVSISDVALLKKLKSSSEWFRWMANELIKRRGISLVPPDEFKLFNIRSIDASVISEPGSTGTDWRLHYSIELFNLMCDEFFISKPKIGESFLNFKVKNNDLLIGDRAYGRFKGMEYVSKNNGYFLTRFKTKAFTLYDESQMEIDLLKNLELLEIGDVLELNCFAVVKNSKQLPIRICAIKKSEEEAAKSIRKSIREIKKKQRRIDAVTLEFNKYIILATNLPKSISAKKIMELYRLRWQIEISFKRLKSIFGLGHLPKKDVLGAKAWLHGKLFVALLAQTIVDESQLFSPWGYPLSL